MNKKYLRFAALVLLVAGGVALFTARDVILFALGTAKGLFILNWMVYTAIAVASFTVSYIMRRVYGPFIERGLRRIFGRK